jgi:hypothetical protein
VTGVVDSGTARRGKRTVFRVLKRNDEEGEGGDGEGGYVRVIRASAKHRKN